MTNIKQIHNILSSSVKGDKERVAHCYSLQIIRAPLISFVYSGKTRPNFTWKYKKQTESPTTNWLQLTIIQHQTSLKQNITQTGLGLSIYRQNL